VAQPKVEIYTRDGCGYCQRALGLLARKQAHVEEINVGRDPTRRREMIERSSGGATYPQIFIDGRHVGGCDDLHALEARGVLDSLLARAGPQGASS
jgi:glutaredoxin 3